jgi:hypothetical protein
MLDITLMKQDESSFEFLLPEHVKQSRPGYTPPSIVLHAFPADETLCVFHHMRIYINQTKPLRGNETKLFISFMKLHHRISRDTISRWIRQTMTNAGVDTQIFKPHSTIYSYQCWPWSCLYINCWYVIVGFVILRLLLLSLMWMLALKSHGIPDAVMTN